MTQPLEPMGRPIQIGRATLRTPGLVGRVEVVGPDAPDGLRASQDFSAALRDAVDETDVRPLETYRISQAWEVAGPPGGARAIEATGEPALELELPALAEGWAQMVLASDEAGVLTWHRPEPSTVDEAEASRGGAGGIQRFLIRRHVPPVPINLSGSGQASRGLVGAIARKLLQVFAFRALETVGGGLGGFVAGKWEAAHRPYRLRSFAPHNYRAADAPPIEDWSPFKDGRALLLLHGTFSRAHSAFGGLDPQMMTELYHRYDGRVLAFDHFTVSHSPEENIRRLRAQIPDQVRLDVDILTHSRGGLVGRLLTEQPEPSIAVRRAVLVAPPNAGTVLADARHLATFLDRFTTLLNLFPDNAVTDILGVVIDVVKHLACGASDRLHGLTAMRPNGPWLAALNGKLGGISPEPAYYVIGSDYEPTAPGLRAFLRDGLTDRIFDDAQNDLVVPTTGTRHLGRFGELPTVDGLDLKATAGVHHTNFFRDPAVATKISGWLTP